MAEEISVSKKLKEFDDVLEFVKENDLPGEIVGAWIWLEFEEKPDSETRKLLKEAGFRWVPKRMRWAHNCGVPRKRGNGDPRHKYGSITIDEDS